MRQLLEFGLVEKVGAPVNQVQAHRICHPMFGGAAGAGADASVRQNQPETPATAALACAKCRRLCKRLTRAAYCRSCHADAELAQQVREVRAANPGILIEELASKIKDRAELRRLTARVRRVLREAAA
jgi:hypothetical protein